MCIAIKQMNKQNTHYHTSPHNPSKYYRWGAVEGATTVGTGRCRAAADDDALLAAVAVVVALVSLGVGMTRNTRRGSSGNSVLKPHFSSVCNRTGCDNKSSKQTKQA